ncbi:MAG: iron-containing alcohol dehydrogenase [Rhodospirillales bacterium]|nr:iron-containing alcohol dehydrogenase [Rhodospirillales bacterium]
MFEARWNYPTTVWTGAGRARDLAKACDSAGIRRPLLVTDAGLAKSVLIAQLRTHLAGLPLAFYGEVRGNPSGSDVEAGLAAYRAHKADGVVAIGGGSALDAGKAIAFMAGQTRPLWDFEDVGDNYLRADISGIAPTVAVPTTAGTGSEVGRASVLVDERTHEKKIIFHPRMLPVLVVADPLLTVGLPPSVTAATGIDAFVHCFEAYCAPGFHPMADGIALEGMRLVAEYLVRAYRDGGDVEARANMLAAASMGAVAFQKGLGAVHALAHPIGALYDTHHGLTNAVLLPYVMRFNRDAIAPRMVLVGRLLGLDRPDFDGVLDWVLRLRLVLGIPATLREIGVDEARAEEIGEMAARDPSASGNPVAVDATSLTTIFRKAVDGDLG